MNFSDHADRWKLCQCGKRCRKGGRQCSACAMKKFRSTEKGRDSCRRSHKKWRQSGKAKWWDTEYKREWRRKRHFYVHADLKQLRKACKRLEAALADASERERVGHAGE